ncbi:MAG: hypothetical protein RR350_01160, partial [Oscillibacter sp.]
ISNSSPWRDRPRQPEQRSGCLGEGIAQTLVSHAFDRVTKKQSNSLWNLFTIFPCKTCPFMLIYRKRELKLHEFVVTGRGGSKGGTTPIPAKSFFSKRLKFW